uniref:Uncharacterized protein n=1 Tax=Candidatus Kentrum sp. TUN TaxID=2126343 RepID=A0A450ZY90_9GAMM|nr:MAG: hypothetical protein BECKTUN1418F_GA0071002_11535 [Candidatus Kentron sp. TUN]VFK63047.1 MAG: hypothetical protein BECKTUN1418D_GA0071000_11954 [Candidatus Kentron sp. TUN]VFK67492.1 MAG: hypothetical protein BECKTUN1418E_GA0071001_11505 [Candidatus Kentron sp. TUN]
MSALRAKTEREGLILRMGSVRIFVFPIHLEKGQLHDEVKSGGNQPTHISMIHRRSLLSLF